jgi:stage V sporulation protein D (sporulation-specific penicillin-binding protein)
MIGEMRDQRWRLIALCVLFAACGVFLMQKIYQYQVVEHQRFRELASEEHYLKKEIVPRRGDILDRQGHPLAISVMYQSLYAYPPSIADLTSTAGSLSRVLGEPEGEILEKLRSGGGGAMLIKRKLPSELSTKIADLNLPGVFLQSEPFRGYPEGSIAPQLIGFVGRDFKGLAGLELSLDRDLGGEPGLLLAERDTIGGEIAIGRREVIPPREGIDAILTIDRQIQRMLERELAEAIEEHRASGGLILVMDVKTGAVLGVASQPDYDLTAEYDPDKLQLYKPTAVTDMYEPGSVMKIITMAAALEERLVNPNTTFTDKGVATIDGVAIRNWDYSAHGVETMTEVLINSCNIGAQHVASMLGADRFYRYIDAFGFGQLTGIELPGESPGLYRTPADKDWTRIDLATNSYGQGIAVTAMQMVRAVGAIANDGVLVKPMIVNSFRYGDSIREMPPVQVRRVISSETARTLTDMMVKVVEDNSLRLSVVPGYTIAGKTGTADLPTAAGYTTGLTYASQVGFAPVGDPRFAMLVRLDGPEKKYGGQVAAPVFKRVAERLFSYMTIPPTGPVPTKTPARPAG